MELYKTIAPDESIQKHVLFSGMPYLANIQYANEPSKQYLHDLFNSVQLKDIVENIIYLELLRREYKVTVGRTGNQEIDFVCHNQNEKLYVQVTYWLASDEIIQRKFGAYDNIRDFLLAKEWN